MENFVKITLQDTDRLQGVFSNNYQTLYASRAQMVGQQLQGRLMFAVTDDHQIERFDHSPQAFVLEGEDLRYRQEILAVEDSEQLYQDLVIEQVAKAEMQSFDDYFAEVNRQMEAMQEFASHYYQAQVSNLETFRKVDTAFHSTLSDELQETIVHDVNRYRDLKYGEYNQALLDFHNVASQATEQDASFMTQITSIQQRLDEMQQEMQDLEAIYPVLATINQNLDEYGIYQFDTKQDAIAFATYLKEARQMAQTEYFHVDLADAQKVTREWEQYGDSVKFKEVFIEPDGIESDGEHVDLDGYIHYGVDMEGKVHDLTALPEPIAVRGGVDFVDQISPVLADNPEDLGHKITDTYGYTMANEPMVDPVQETDFSMGQ